MNNEDDFVDDLQPPELVLYHEHTHIPDFRPWDELPWAETVHVKVPRTYRRDKALEEFRLPRIEDC